jgi:FkbM family methyltransferase
MTTAQAPINVCDIGGRFGFHRSWADFTLPVNYYCFDADPDEAERLRHQAEASAGAKPITVVSGAVAERVGTAPFYLYSFRAASSLYELNTEATYRYRNLTLDEVLTVNTINLDAFLEQQKAVPHFVSIDAQGASLQILRGGQKALQECLGVRCELEFFQLYKNAPLAGEALAFMRSKGFRLLRLEMCGPGLYGISTEMNSFSVSPWDAKPSSCDAILANEERISAIYTDPTLPDCALLFGYFVAFCIFNGCGYYGLELVQGLKDRDLLGRTLEAMPGSVAENVKALCNFYLALPRPYVKTDFRENLNTAFDGNAIATSLFGHSGYALAKQAETKLRKIYSQPYEP